MSRASVQTVARTDFYRESRHNKWRAFLILLPLVALIVLAGVVFDVLLGFGGIGIVVAFVIALVISLVSYLASDRVALAVSHARPAEDPEYQRYHNLVEGLCIAAGLPKPRLYVIDDPAPNAFATGRNPKHSALAVTTGLLDTMNRVELEGVLAHELSHVKSYDMLPGTVAVTAVGSLLVVPPVAAQLMQLAMSRRRELLADASGVGLTRYPPGLSQALKKLQGDTAIVRHATRATAQLWIESPLERHEGKRGSWLNRAFDTHPPIDERIHILESM